MTDDPDLLRAYLDRAHARIDALARELAAEQALTRRLKSVIALLPFNPRRGAADARPRRPRIQRATPGGLVTVPRHL